MMAEAQHASFLKQQAFQVVTYAAHSPPPSICADQVEGSTTSYDSRHGLLYNYNYNYPASQTGKLPGRQSLDRQSSLGSSCREGQNFVFTREKKGGTAQIYKGTEQHYASTPIVRQEYSRPFQYVLVDRGEYVTPHNQYS